MALPAPLPLARQGLGALGTAYWALLLLLAPIKLATMVSDDGGMLPPVLLDWAFSIWPSFLAPVAVGGGLLLVLTYAPLPPLAVWRRDVPLLLPAWALVVACLLGGIATTEIDQAQLFFMHVWSVAALVLALWLHLQAQPRSKPWLLAAILLGTGWIIFSGWYQYLWGFAETRQYMAERAAATHSSLPSALELRLNQDRVFASFAVPNSYAGHLLLVIPLALALVVRWGRLLQPPVAGRIFAGLLATGVLVTGGVAFFWTGSRAALLALGAMGGLLALAFAWREQALVRRHRVLLGAGLLVALVAVGGALVHQSRKRHSTNAYSSADYRRVYYVDALKTFATHPVTGAGLGEYLSYHLVFKPAWVDEDARLVHNTVLQFLAECGIVGGLAALLFCGQGLWVLWALWRGRWPAEDWWLGVALLLGILGWQMHSQMDFNFHVPASAWFAALFPLLLVDWEQLPRAARPPLSLAVGGRVMLLVVALVCLWPLLRIPGESLLAREHELASAKLPAVQLAGVAVDAGAALPHSPHPWWLLAEAALGQGDFNTAESAARRAMGVVPRRAKSYVQLAKALVGQGRIVEARAAIAAALQRSPTHVGYLALQVWYNGPDFASPRAPGSDPTPTAPPAVPPATP